MTGASKRLPTERRARNPGFHGVIFLLSLLFQREQHVSVLQPGMAPAADDDRDHC